MSIASRLGEVRTRIERAARACGRDPASVRLVAVSKTHPPEAIREAYEAGQRAFGENYAQELAAKAEALAGARDLEWHFLGHLQTNKARVVVRHASVVHGVDSVALARELGKRVAAGQPGGPSRPLPVLVEVNVGGEARKAGVRPDALPAVIEAVRSEPSLLLRGLMTVPPAGDLDAARRAFDELVSLRGRFGGAASMPDLSMGMSADLEVAVACGATLVRIGTAIFGPRESRTPSEPPA